MLCNEILYIVFPEGWLLMGLSLCINAPLVLIVKIVIKMASNVIIKI
jgi:hypothetical protein